MSNNNIVGYKNPPVKTQFKKGQSGNSKGRPKGSKNKTISDILEKELQSKLKLKDGTTITKKEAIAKKNVNELLQTNNIGKLQNGLNLISKLENISEENILAKDFLQRLFNENYINKKDAEDFIRRRRDPNFNFPPTIQKLYNSYNRKGVEAWDGLRQIVFLSYIYALMRRKEFLKIMQFMIDQEFAFWQVIKYMLKTLNLNDKEKEEIEALIQTTRSCARPTFHIKCDVEMVIYRENHNIEYLLVNQKDNIKNLPLYEEKIKYFLDKDTIKKWAKGQEDFKKYDFDKIYEDLLNTFWNFCGAKKSTMGFIENNYLEEETDSFIKTMFANYKDKRDELLVEKEIFEKYGVKIEIPDEFDDIY